MVVMALVAFYIYNFNSVFILSGKCFQTALLSKNGTLGQGNGCDTALPVSW